VGRRRHRASGEWSDMKPTNFGDRATIAVALVVAMGVGAALGAGIRPAQAGDGDNIHRIAVATEQIDRQLETMSRHLEGMQRCTCK
jgi:hypothetical protein